jgi:N-methylhydantoinase A
MQALFEAAYHARFRVALPQVRANLVNLNTSVIGTRPEIDLGVLIEASGRKRALGEARTGVRRVWFGGWVEAPVYWRDHLPLAAELAGPAVIEQMDCTTLVGPGDRVTQDGDGNLIVEVAG